MEYKASDNYHVLRHLSTRMFHAEGCVLSETIKQLPAAPLFIAIAYLLKRGFALNVGCSDAVQDMHIAACSMVNIEKATKVYPSLSVFEVYVGFNNRAGDKIALGLNKETKAYDLVKPRRYAKEHEIELSIAPGKTVDKELLGNILSRFIYSHCSSIS